MSNGAAPLQVRTPKLVSEAASIGGYARQYQIEVDPDKLRFHNMPLDELVMAIRGSKVDVGAKAIETSGMEFVVRGKGFLSSGGDAEKAIRDIEETVIVERDGVPLRIKDVARVQMGPDFRRGALDPDNPPTPSQERLRSLRARRQQVVHSLTQEKNRLATAPDAEAHESIQEAVDFYDRQLRELDRRIAELTSVDPAFRHRLALLVSVPGVGVVTAAGLLAELPELGALNRGQAAKLVGLAPINRDSGSLRGQRMIGGGRAQVRRSLYMATIVATQHDKLIRSHYRQLLARGKTKMTALVACMRKLLLILNAMIKNNSPWNEQTAS